ncbi:MAG: hypothetical protein ACK4TK_00405 [Thiobacillaceae bacterium]
MMPCRSAPRGLLSALGLIWAVAVQAAPVLLAVEGVNPYRLLAPILGGAAEYAATWEDGYLERSPLAAALAKATGAEVRRIAWSGIPTDAAGLRTAMAALQAELATAQAQGRPVWLLTHSLGSVIAYLALAEGEAGAPVEVFISLSSPLGRPPLMRWLAQFHPGLPLATMAESLHPPVRAGRWLNVYTPWDPFGGPIVAAGVENLSLALTPSLPLPTPADWIAAHTLPFRTTAWAEMALVGPPASNPAQ